MKLPLAVVLIVAAICSVAFASPPGVRVAESENGTTVGQEVTTLVKETVAPSTAKPTQLKVNQVAGKTEQKKEKETDLPVTEETEEADETSPVKTTPEQEPEDVETVVTKAGEKVTPVKSVPKTVQKTEQVQTKNVVEKQQNETESEPKDDQDAETFLGFLSDGLQHVKRAISDLQLKVENFFVAPVAVDEKAGKAKN